MFIYPKINHRDMGLWSKGINRSRTGECRLGEHVWNISNLDIIKDTIDRIVADILHYPEIKTCEYKRYDKSVRWEILGKYICEYEWRDDDKDNEFMMLGNMRVKIFNMTREHVFGEHQDLFERLDTKLARLLAYAPVENNKRWTYIMNY